MISIRKAAILLVPLLWAHSAHAHGIAGNRYFDGTLTFDDPAVADEAILPYYENLAFPMQGSNATQNRINWAFARLLTPTLAVTVDSGWLHQNWPIGRTSGFDRTNVGIKYEAYRNNQHEALISASLAWGIGHSGARAVGADAPDTGGVLLSLTPALLVMPAMDWLLRLAVQLPVGQFFYGVQTEYPAGVLALVKDF